MDSRIKQSFLTTVDLSLEPLGFKRPRSGYEWKRKVSKHDVEWIHLNFGLSSITPSFGLTFMDLKRVLPKEAGAVFSVFRLLSGLSGNSYPDDSPPADLAKDILKFIPAELKKLSDRNALIEALSEDKPKQWPVWSLSDRNRLLPLLIASSGEVEAAKGIAQELVQNYSDVDQIRPELAVYVRYLCEAYSV